MLLFWILSFSSVAFLGCAEEAMPPPCDNDIYCYGPLLHTVQMAELYVDSKTFVDMKMKRSRDETMMLFEEMINRTANHPTLDDIERFVNESFDPPGSEFEPWEPSDWKQHPRFLEQIGDRSLRSWATNLNDLWKFLGRKMKEDVRVNSEHYSIIWVPNPVIVPGGRFREFYYWDSYWIIRGLLLSEMYGTVKGMLENFISIVDRYGLIPNGGRVYYLMRSQPPLLTPMVDSYFQATNDLEFLDRNIATLEKEFAFWMSNHTIKVEKDGVWYTLARYNDISAGPRPESYKEDVHMAQYFRTEDEKNEFYSELKTAAESGWDFSSRWFILNGTNQGNLTNIKIKSIIPVDLNAMIYWNADLLSKFYKKLGNMEKAQEYGLIAGQWMEAVEKVLWHEEVGTWLDYDMINQIKRDQFYPSNLAPLWTGCYDPEKKGYYLDYMMEYIRRSKVMVNEAGIPATTSHTGEQWDYPNAWPPMQHMVIIGLDNTGDEYAKDLAFEIAERWVRSNFKAYNETNAMFEKYDATVVGGYGGGGEYEVQLGFGWSNGVVMELLAKYGDRLTATEVFGSEELVSSAQLLSPATPQVAPLLAVLAAQTTIAAGCIGAIVFMRKYNPRDRYSRINTQAD
ncbi:alpha,alpha-trehalase [Nesidiocoris tenuis]|uniref:Trehalase n=1 Tax=Nesidiocoris tenuis TaxID=355587 RepID=A0ABN7B217_9HEMI|nr:alpha,alpha-trehalase [Nesidiocoris tenuis]